MKKLFFTTLISLLLCSHVMVVNAAHQHTDSCYTIQGAHTHTGSTTSGGGCYNTANKHVHSGDSINGGGCYGTPVYHVHEGQEGQVTANGCYTLLSTTTRTCQVTGLNPIAGRQETRFCNNCQAERTCTHYAWTVSHSSCGIANDWSQHGYIKCNTCGTCVYTWGSGTINPVGTYFQASSHEYNVSVYELGCNKTEQTVEYYELSCGKTTDTIEGYSLSCGQQESAGTKVLTCTIPESVDTPEPAPVEKQEPSYTYKDLNKTMYTQTEINVRNTPSTDGALLGRLAAGEEVKVTGQCNETAWYRIDYNGSAGYITNLYLGTEKPVEEPAETVPVETIPEETVEEVTISIDASDFDFALDYSFTGDGLYVILKPTNSLALADIPYSWDNKVTWNTNTECLFTEPGEYRISVKNVDGEIKTKILTVDFELQTVTIENEETALANANIEEPKSSGVKIPFKAIFIVILVLAAVGGIGFLVFKLLAGAGITAKVIDDGTDVSLGTVKFKKKGSSFEVIISDKILMNKDTTLALLPDANALKKYRGYSLTVKSSVGVVETAILNKIEVEF